MREPEKSRGFQNPESRGLGRWLRDAGVPGAGGGLLQKEASGRLRGGGGIQLGLVGWGQTHRGISGRRSPVGNSVGAGKPGKVGSTPVWQDPKARVRSGQ